jgi:hypothetical protein
MIRVVDILRYKSGDEDRIWLFDNNLGEIPVLKKSLILID